MQPSFYCRLSKAQSFGGLGNIEVLHVSKNEDRAIDVRQLRESFGYRSAHFLLLNGVTREIAPVGELLRVKRLIVRGFRRVLVNGVVKMLPPLSSVHLRLFRSPAWPTA